MHKQILRTTVPNTAHKLFKITQRQKIQDLHTTERMNGIEKQANTVLKEGDFDSRLKSHETVELKTIDLINNALCRNAA